MRVNIKRINFSDNYLDYDKFAKYDEQLVRQCKVIRQGTYIHNPINFRNVQNDNIYNIVNGVNHNIVTIYSTQSVHLSSINKSVLASIELLQEYIKTHDLPLCDLDNIRNDPYIIRINKENHLTKACFIETVNSYTKLNLQQTFELIWTVVLHQSNNGLLDINDIINRLVEELSEGANMCFTGKYNRLVNSLCGLVDGIKVGISESEELQIEFGRLIAKLTNQPRNNVNANENANEHTHFKAIYDEACVILSLTSKDVQNTWLSALLDMQPIPIKINLYGTNFLQTWDNKILDLYTRREVIVSFINGKIDVQFVNEDDNAIDNAMDNAIDNIDNAIDNIDNAIDNFD